MKLTQLIDMTRCASYDVSTMTNGAAKVLVLDCVSFEQNVWCSNGMGDKYATKVRWELHLLVPSSSRIHWSGGWTCALTFDCEQEVTTHTEK